MAIFTPNIAYDKLRKLLPNKWEKPKIEEKNY